MRPRVVVIRQRGYNVSVLGTKRAGLRDAYHAMLRAPWWALLLGLVVGYLALNLLFGVAFAVAGGVANAEPGSVRDAFFFSIQTMATIGYGAMYPVSNAAHALVVVESVVGMLVTAVVTGVVFVRFSQTRARVMFSRVAALGRMDGVPTLQVRVGNERGNSIVDATFRMVMVRTDVTAEGVTFYRTLDLPLARSHTMTLSRAWLLRHEVTPDSPLHGHTPETLRQKEVEIMVQLTGLDETSMQQVAARHTYTHADIRLGCRLADITREEPNGDLVVDLTHFHDVVEQPVPQGAPAAADPVSPGPP